MRYICVVNVQIITKLEIFFFSNETECKIDINDDSIISDMRYVVLHDRFDDFFDCYDN